MAARKVKAYDLEVGMKLVCQCTHKGYTIFKFFKIIKIDDEGNATCVMVCCISQEPNIQFYEPKWDMHKESRLNLIIDNTLAINELLISTSWLKVWEKHIMLYDPTCEYKFKDNIRK